VKESELPSAATASSPPAPAAGHGGAAAEEAEQAVKKYGGDLSGHETQPVTVAMIEEATGLGDDPAATRRPSSSWMPEPGAKIELLDPSGTRGRRPGRRLGRVLPRGPPSRSTTAWRSA
jgi:hypothetical protein